MLKLGFPKETGFYTSLMIEMIARFANTIQYIFNLNLQYDYVSIFAVLTLIGAVIGSLVFHPRVKKLEIQWLIFMIISIVLFIAAIINTIADILSIMVDLDDGVGTFYIYEY